MKNNIGIKILISIFGLLIIFNCAGSKKSPDLSPEASEKTLKNTPKWFINTPNKEGFRYVAATSTSQDMQLAINKSRLDAAQTLVGQVGSEMNGHVKRVQEETGLGQDSHIIDQFSQTQEQVISTSLNDWKVVEKEVQEEVSDTGKIYRAFVLVEWDEGAAQKRLLAKIKEDEQLYTAIRSTELFEDMEEKVKDYRKRYNK